MSQGFFTRFYVPPPEKKPRLPQFFYNEQTNVVLNSGTDLFWSKQMESLQGEIVRLKATITRLDKALATASAENVVLSQNLLKEQRPFVQARKPFCELNNARKAHKKAEVRQWLSAQIEKLPSEWKVTELKVKVGEDELSLFANYSEQETPRNVQQWTVRRALKAKDDGDISDAAYNEVKQVPGSNLPSLCSLVKERCSINNVIPIKEFKDLAVKGCSRSIADILKYMYSDQNFATAFKEDGGLNGFSTLRFSGDGRKTTKKLGSVMTAFSLPSENLLERSPDKEYCISVYDGKEDYDLLTDCLKSTIKEMNNLKSNGLFLEDQLFKIDWLLCADWKFMAILLGINAPSSEHFCLWCECCKAKIRDFSIKTWLITRTYEKCCSLAKSTDGSNTFGVKHRPLLNIDFSRVVVDTLHLKLRIRGKLLNQVACWALEQKKRSQMVAAMSDIGVTFCFYDTQDESGKTTTKWTSLDCDDLETVVKQLDLHFLSNMTDKSKTSLDCLTKPQLILACKKYHLPSSGTKDILRANLKSFLSENKIKFQVSSIQSCETKVLDVDRLTTVWRDFEVLADALKVNPGDAKYLEPDDFQELARKWAKDFRRETFDEDVIPYIHVLVYHVPQFLDKFKTIHHFNCQTVEKKNHLQNRTFHRGSQKGGKNSNYTVQIMEKENRKLFYRINQVERQKRKYTKKG